MSTKKALHDLGLGPCFHMEDVILNNLPQQFIDYFDGNKKSLLDYLDNAAYRSTLDMPIITIFDDLLKVKL